MSSEKQRYIDVTGSAEITVQPDEIELEIVLKEYGGKLSKIALESIEKKFFRILEENNVCLENVAFGNASLYWYHWWYNRRTHYQDKTFKVSLDKNTDFLTLVKALDFQGVHKLNIASTSNKKLQEFHKDLKISAVKAAKEKADYLLQAIDEKIGSVISIIEVPQQVNNFRYRNQIQVMSNVSIKSGSNKNEIANVANIKLRYEVKARFEIL